jgi:hypothetical protein
MPQRTFQETECERCHMVERKQQDTPFIPPAWRYVQSGYFGARDFVPEQTKLLCGACMTGLKFFLDGGSTEAGMLVLPTIMVQQPDGSLIPEEEHERRAGLVK